MNPSRQRLTFLCVWPALLLSMIATQCSSRKAPPPKATINEQERPVRPRFQLACNSPGARDSQNPVHSAWLPAVSRDGRQIAIAASTEDGARGATNLKLLVLDLEEDAIAHEQVILNPAERWACGQSDERVQTRIADANAWLGDRSWNPMVALHTARERGGPTGTHMAWTPGPDGPFVTWNEPDLTVVSLQLGHLSRAERTLLGWLALTGRLEPGDGELCHQPSYLSGAWVNLKRRALLTRLYFTGNDMCWEHDSRFHALRLPEPVNASTVCANLGGRCAPTCDEPDTLNPRDDACATAGGICCAPKNAVVPCTRLGATCAETCPDGAQVLDQPGCQENTRCCMAASTPPPPG